MRWLVLDEIVSIEPGKQARAMGRVPAGNPASPECLMIEMMAQTGALLLGAETGFHRDVVFTKIEDAVFEGTAGPGDRLEITAVPEDLRPEAVRISAAVSRAGAPVARSRFLLMSVGRLAEDRAEPLTFHSAFMEHFNVRAKVVLS
jgi:3-hydroxymyristoyl/3-hydroxydecanoyl-(acyl carrier protein) dehydratase